MKFGTNTFLTDYSIQPVALARALEERGFESMFVTEHTHIPTSRRTPSYIPGELPQEYWHTHDAFTALGAAAAVTSTIKIGTGVCLVTEHHPIALAKRAASLDLISNGRFLFGIGAGWNAEEMEHHGVPFQDRWKITRERVLAMRRIWTEDEPEFHGDYVDFEPIWSWPKPVQAGGPPLLLGANSKWTWDRIIEYCDGWMAIDGALVPGMGDVEAGMATLREKADAAGRPWDAIDVTVATGPVPDRIEQLVALGVDRIVFQVPSEPEEKVLPILDEWARLIEPFG